MLDLTPDQRVTRAMSHLLIDAPFFGMLALELDLVRDDTIDTMATDGRAIYWSADFVAGQSDAKLKGVIAHEVDHNVLGHHARRDGRDPELWNIAADYAINLDLIRDGFELPDGALIDAAYEGMSAEQIYSTLEANPSKRPAPGAGQFGQVRDATAPDGSPASEADKVAEIKTWSERAATAAAIEKSARAGTMSSSAARAIKALREPDTDWRAMLQEFVNARSRDDFSWSRPNRRHIGAGLYLPGRGNGRIARIVAAVDTSGSINDRLYAQFVDELQAIIDANMVDVITVVFADTRVQEIHEFGPGDVIDCQAPKGGGTAFADTMAWAADNAPDAAVLVYFTDLQCSRFGDDPGMPVIWASYGRPTAVPFGTVATMV